VDKDSTKINSLDEAKMFYAEHLAGRRRVTCYGSTVAIVFPPDGTHLFSEGVPKDATEEERAAFVAGIPPEERVERKIAKRKVEVRRFDVRRARLMDRVLLAISLFTVSIPGTGRDGHEKRMLHGPALPNGTHMRVVLRPGPGEAYTCTSAYAVSEQVWLEIRRAIPAKFPP
jgi:hypothetical protein